MSISDSGKWVHVELPGHGTFWIQDDVLRGEAEGALAPEEHIEDGDLKLFDCFSGDSYAHVFPDGRIMRYRQVIASRDELVRLASEPR